MVAIGSIKSWQPGRGPTFDHVDGFDGQSPEHDTCRGGPAAARLSTGPAPAAAHFARALGRDVPG